MADMVINPGTEAERRMGSSDTVVLQPGDVLEVRSAGGGGRGNPLEREPWRVAQDVARGFVSEEAARRDYGVVLHRAEVDEAATNALRAGMAASTAEFGFGKERAAWEAIWTADAYARLTEVLAGLPVHWRFFAKTEILRRMEVAGIEGVNRAVKLTRTRFPEVPMPSHIRSERKWAHKD